jgi:hypothetical protein
VSSEDKTDHQETGDAFAEMAQVAASRQTEAERRAAVTYAMLAIYHELRRNDLGAKIDALSEQVEELTEQVERAVTQQGDTESRISNSISDLGDIVERGRPRHR